MYEEIIHDLMESGYGCVDNWLSAAQTEHLRKHLLERYHEDAFKRAGIGNKFNLILADEVRKDTIFWLDRNSMTDTEHFFFDKLSHFIGYLNRTCFTGIADYEFHYAVYEKGAFYKKHVDRFNNDDKRRFSMVYYLTDNWQDGDGGELRLYAQKECVIQPVGGRLVFFDSTIEHEVLRSNTQRLSLTGWLKLR